MNADRSGTKTKVTDKVTTSSTVTENGTGTYQNKLDSTSSTALANKVKYPNQYARYYYNLDDMSNSDAAENAVLWSVKQYAASNISGNFASSDSPFSFEIATNVDLSGYSFYPVYSTSGITLKNANLTFDYAGIRDAAEAVFVSPTVTDGFIRDPGNNDSGETARNQHFLMHSGLFINQAEGSTLTLDTVKLIGNFLEVGDYKGVLVSGTSNGSLTINGLTLDGIKPNVNTGYLLVNKIKREYTTSRAIELSINDVITTDKYTLTDTNNNKTTAQIANSLFGTVDGPKIDITLSAMQLDARKADESDSHLTAADHTKLNTAYKTVNSIFTTSTFFESINTNASASLIYNYSYDEDWKSDGSGPRKVTYGKEVSESVQWEDRENKYSENGVNSIQFTDPTTNSNTAAEYSFASGWLPYVAVCSLDKDGNGYYKRELKVNVAADTASEGCGTYNDPYQIKSNSDLVNFSKVMYDGYTGVELILPKSNSSYDDLSEVTSGNRWCNDNHAKYKWDQSSSTFTSTESGAEPWNLEEVRLYLENAYYLVKNNVTLTGVVGSDSGFLGLGGNALTDNTGKYAFRGVIVGEKNTDDTPKWTITNESNHPLVNISNGCVIKDIKVVQKADVSLNQTKWAYNEAYFGYKTPSSDAGCYYYGGIIGEIMGGDNIIDSSYVSYKYTEEVTTGEGENAVTTTVNKASKITLSGTYGTIVPVGGYVGVVVFGGLIFKNMNASKTTLTETGLNVINGDQVATSTHSFTEDVDKLDGKSVVFKHGDNLYMTSTPTTSGNRHGFNTNTDCAQAVSIVFEKSEGTTNQYYLRMGSKYLQLYNTDDKGGLQLANKGDTGTLFTVEKRQDLTYSFKSYLNKDYYINWNSGRGFSGANQWYSDNAITLEEFDEVVEYNLSDDSNQASGSAIYVNPLVGRVINGYAINETTSQFSVTENNHYHDADGRERTGTQHSLKNGTKHYSIADVNKNQTNKLGVTAPSDSVDGIITVPNAQALFVLSLITQSCAGTAQTADGEYVDSLSYGIYGTSNAPTVYGMSHNADYSSVGSASSNANADFVLASGDTATKTAVPYIIKRYTNTSSGTTARCVTSTLGYYDINLTGTTTYQLPDSFRGIGSVGNYEIFYPTEVKNKNEGQDITEVYANRANNKYCLKVDVFTGNGCAIDEDIYLNKYQLDNYFNVLHKGINQDVSSNVQVYQPNTRSNNHGIGLFDIDISINS